MKKNSILDLISSNSLFDNDFDESAFKVLKDEQYISAERAYERLVNDIKETQGVTIAAELETICARYQGLCEDYAFKVGFVLATKLSKELTQLGV